MRLSPSRRAMLEHLASAPRSSRVSRATFSGVNPGAGTRAALWLVRQGLAEQQEDLPWFRCSPRGWKLAQSMGLGWRCVVCGALGQWCLKHPRHRARNGAGERYPTCASTRSITPRAAALLRVLCDLEGWMRPMDLGARDASWHSATLTQLVRRGLVERRERGSSRSFTYRATARGHVVAVARAGFCAPPP